MTGVTTKVCLLFILFALFTFTPKLFAISISPTPGSSGTRVCVATSTDFVAVTITASESEDHAKPGISGDGWVEDSWDYPTLIVVHSKGSPGEFTVSASDAGGSVSTTIKIVAVASLTASPGTEIDDGDGNANTKKYLACVLTGDGLITVTAVPTPGLSENELPGCWTLEGGDGDGKLQKSVSSFEAGSETVTCTAGSSSRIVTVCVLASPSSPTSASEMDIDVVEVAPTNSEDYGGTHWPGTITVDIGVYLDCDSMTWKCKLTTASTEIRTWSRLPAGVSPASVEDATAANYCDMLESLDNFGEGDYYVLAAVEAHEQVHIDVITEHVSAVFSTLKSAIEGLSVSATCAKSASDVKAEIQGMGAYNTAVANAVSSAGAAILDDSRHVPDSVPENSTLAAAELSVTSYISAAIESLAAMNNWAPCP